MQLQGLVNFNFDQDELGVKVNDNDDNDEGFWLKITLEVERVYQGKVNNSTACLHAIQKR